ncbi:unnamed protein product [Timema podura]|uniref:Uncharacterized protein n=1 Tax=Timema podura TaxID=61482 RepID=A0ABN7P8D5_TIMPD|nr:unnamed protein product [Timema podura]
MRNVLNVPHVDLHSRMLDTTRLMKSCTVTSMQSKLLDKTLLLQILSLSLSLQVAVLLAASLLHCLAFLPAIPMLQCLQISLLKATYHHKLEPWPLYHFIGRSPASSISAALSGFSPSHTYAPVPTNITSQGNLSPQTGTLAPLPFHVS